MDGIALRLEGVSKQYRIGGARDRYDTLRDTLTRRSRPKDDASRTIWALRDVTIDVPMGEAVGLIGRNGAGKTTLLRILSRITEPTAGIGYVSGRVGSLLEVGTGFHPELTGRENIFLNGAILGMRRREILANLDAIVDFAGVERFLDTPVKRFSSGMQVRLAFAVAAHLETDVLLVDEVLAVGDAEFQRRCLGKMGGLASSGRTVILVSHNMASITRLCRRALLLDQGRLVKDGPTDEVVATYLSSELGSGAKRTWPVLEEAPGDDLVRLREIAIVDEAGLDVQTIDVRKPVGIRIVADVLSAGEPIVPFLTIYNDQGSHVFSAIDTDPAWQRSRPPGRYIATAWIPGNLLNEGTMVVRVAMSTFASGGKNVRHAEAQEAVAFQVIDPGEGDTARGNYAGNWSAPVRPLLSWDTRAERL